MGRGPARHGHKSRAPEVACTSVTGKRELIIRRMQRIQRGLRQNKGIEGCASSEQGEAQMAVIGWRCSLVVGMALVAVGCGAPGQAGPSSVARSHPADVTAVSALAGVPCTATTAKPTKPIPAAFRPVAVVQCYQVARGIPGNGLWRFEVKQRADHRLAAFIAALRRPSVRTPPQIMCAAVGYLDPSFALIDRHGRILRPALPVKECGQPFPAAISNLQHLPWVTVSVRRTVQIATRAELQAGCDPQWKDVIQLESGSGGLQPSAGGPAFTPRPPRLRICIYRDSSYTFIRGGLISQAAESKVLGDIQGGRTSTQCRRPHTEYAVLLAVSPAYRGGQFAEAELGGCYRVLRPDNQVGTISPAGLDIIGATGRPSS
jgi:hypothetical protein